MKTTFKLLAVTAIFGFAILSSAAQAGTITSKSFTGDADSGISTTKNYVLAVDLAGSSPLAINGVTFSPNPAPVGNVVSGANGGVTYAVTIPGFSTFTGFGNNLTGSTNTLAQSFYYSGNGGTADETVTFGGLTPNAPYQAVFYSVGFGNADGRLQAVGDDQNPPPGTANYDENVNGNGNGSELIDSFIPTSSTFTIDINSINGNASFHEYGFSLQAVPEPSAIVALVGLCGMGLIGVIRYRRRKAA
jgi:hypothetical protein